MTVVRIKEEERTIIVSTRPPDAYPSGINVARKMFATALRSAAKARMFRFTSDVVWKREGDFLVKGFGALYRNRFEAWMTCSVKPLVADDIWWEVLGMEGNKNERLSLHATGAFVFNGVDVGLVEGDCRHLFFSGEDDIELVASEMVAYLEEVSSVFLNSINRDVRRYFELLADGDLHPANRCDPFYRCIGLIGLGDYESALELIEHQIATDPELLKYDAYGIGDAFRIKEYCERKLAEERS